MEFIDLKEQQNQLLDSGNTLREDIDIRINDLLNSFFKICSNPKPKIKSTSPSLVPRIIKVMSIDFKKFLFFSK